MLGKKKAKKKKILLMNTQKEINKYVKEKDENNANLISKQHYIHKSIDNYSLIIQSLVKNIKNDNNSLLFS